MKRQLINQAPSGTRARYRERKKRGADINEREREGTNETKLERKSGRPRRHVTDRECRAYTSPTGPAARTYTRTRSFFFVVSRARGRTENVRTYTRARALCFPPHAGDAFSRPLPRGRDRPTDARMHPRWRTQTTWRGVNKQRKVHALGDAAGARRGLRSREHG
jgi:hypothetical protein